jgi:hypothetical protein
MPDILLIHPWRHACPSAVLFTALIGAEHRDRVAWVHEPGTDLQALPVATSPEVHLPWNSRPWGRLTTAALWRLRLYHAAGDVTVSWLLDRCADEMCRVVERVRPRALWCLAHDLHTAIATRVAERTNLPLHVTVHDEPVERVRRSSRWPHMAARVVGEHWPRLLRMATSIDVVSPEMAAEVRAISGQDSLVLPPAQRHALGSDPAPPPLRECRIGLASSWYTMSRPHVALHAARRLHDARHPETPLRVVWVDGAPALRYPDLRTAIESHAADRVECLPRLTEHEAIRTFQSCHVLYLPFWYDNHTLNRLSNPSKLCLYMPAVRPIIVHGPPDSVPIRWAREHGAAATWTSLDPGDFAEAFQQALELGRDWPALRESYARFYREPFSLESQRERFWTMLTDTTLAVRHGEPGTTGPDVNAAGVRA